MADRQELGWCEEAQTYCSIAEDNYKQIRTNAIEEVIRVISPYIQDINSNEVFAHLDNDRSVWEWLSRWKMALYIELEQLKEKQE